MTYETEYSNFPNQPIALHGFKNADNTVINYQDANGHTQHTTAINLVNKINSLRRSTSSSDRAELASIMASAGNQIKPYLVDAETFNTLEQEIYNTQLYASAVFQTIHFSTNQPFVCFENDVWIGTGDN